ncbi:MAG: disulfide bond formation protein B [Endozoicomonas sp. (ex Botrylloides leachii)]|nr:disulfide bond formation protein B [Endozoicomonas sp. (ex Botrylloides leachii)]
MRKHTINDLFEVRIKKQKVACMTIPNSRILFALAALICSGLMSFSLLLQYMQGLEPCPLCISQRIVVLLLMLVTSLASLHNPKGKGFKIYGGLVILLGLAGIALASRQIWIQHLPPEDMPTCMPDLEYLATLLPFTQLITIMLTGTGNCSEVQWVFIGLSIPKWTLLLFSSFTAFGFFEVLKKPKS